MNAPDYECILQNNFGITLGEDLIRKMIIVNENLARDAEIQRDGGPFEFNLRDLIRWAELSVKVGDYVWQWFKF